MFRCKPVYATCAYQARNAGLAPSFDGGTIRRQDRCATQPFKLRQAGTNPRGEYFEVSRKDYLFTSESVSEGHPDKVSDQISDAILDAFIANDIKLGIADDSQTNTRLGCETLVTTNKIVIAGEGRASDPYMKKYGKQTIVNREALTRIAREGVEGIG